MLQSGVTRVFVFDTGLSRYGTIMTRPEKLYTYFLLNPDGDHIGSRINILSMFGFRFIKCIDR